MPDADTTPIKPRRSRKRAIKVKPAPEPVYRFVRGQGWIPGPPRESWKLTAEDCKGDWLERDCNYWTVHYPRFCGDWQVLENVPKSDLKIFDVLPGGNNIRQITFIGVSIRGIKIYKPNMSDPAIYKEIFDRYQRNFPLVLRPPV